MLHPVWPSVYFWYFLGLCSSLLWLIPSMEMEFIKKSTPRVGVFVRLTILFSWFGGNTVLSIIFLSLMENPLTDHFFRGYERVGRIVGYALLLFGNIGLYYYSEKSIACMLTFLFLGFFCLCTLFYIQPFTDFGVLDFFLSASLTQALSLFGLHIYSWLVFIAVMILASLRYQLELVLLQQPPREVESGRMANADSEGEARDTMERAKDMIQVLQTRREVDSERNRSNVPYLRIPKNSGRDSELATDVIDRDSELARDVIDLDLERIVSNIIVPSFQNLWYLNLSGVKQKLNDNTRQQISKLRNLKRLVVPGEKLNPNIISDSTISESQALKLLQQPPREVESEGESESVER